MLPLPDGLEKALVLTLESPDSNAIKQTRDANKNAFSISVDKRIAIIKEYSEEYRR